MRTRLVTAIVIATALLTACGGSSDDPDTSATVGSDGGDKNAAAETEDTEPGESEDNMEGTDSEQDVEIVDYGYGQSDSAVTGVVLVTANEEDVLGKFVTVSTNFLDADGQIISTEDQVESFNWEDQQIAFPLFLYLEDLPKGTKVASIDPVVTVGDGFDEEARAPLPVLEASSITKSDYGPYYTASFGFTNDTDEDLKDLRVGAACYNAAGKIIGGDTTYPDVAPAGRTIRIDVDDISMSAKPKTCKAFLNYSAF